MSKVIPSLHVSMNKAIPIFSILSARRRIDFEAFTFKKKTPKEPPKCTRTLNVLRGMCGHILHLRRKMQTPLELACFCPNLTKTVVKRCKSGRCDV